VADDRRCDDAALQASRQPNVKRKRLPSAHDLIGLPVAFDLKTVLVQTPAPKAMPIDQVLEWLDVHAIAPW
jgi:hypothetical protein